jgi:TRAP-type transport system periplasmic protein
MGPLHQSLKILFALTLAFGFALSFEIPTAYADKITIKVALSGCGNDHIFVKMSKLMGKEIEKRVPGRVDWQIFSCSQLGGDSTIMKGLVLGTHMLTMNGSWFQSIEPEFGIFDTPLLIKDRKQAKEVIAAVQGDLAKAILPKGIVLLGIGDLGFREISNNVRPIVKPSDLHGIKLRVPGNPQSIATFKAFGANPTPMNISQLYMALRQGVVDGQENPLASIWAYKFYEVQKYISMTNHVFTATFVGASAAYWNKWPPDVQRAIRAATKIACNFSFDEDARLEDVLKRKILAANPSVRFNNVDFAALQKKAKSLYPAVEKKVGSAIWNKAMGALH